MDKLSLSTLGYQNVLGPNCRYLLYQTQMDTLYPICHVLLFGFDSLLLTTAKFLFHLPGMIALFFIPLKEEPKRQNN